MANRRDAEGPRPVSFPSFQGNLHFNSILIHLRTCRNRSPADFYSTRAPDWSARCTVARSGGGCALYARPRARTVRRSLSFACALSLEKPDNPSPKLGVVAAMEFLEQKKSQVEAWLKAQPPAVEIGLAGAGGAAQGAHPGLAAVVRYHAICSCIPALSAAPSLLTTARWPSASLPPGVSPTGGAIGALMATFTAMEPPPPPGMPAPPKAREPAAPAAAPAHPHVAPNGRPYARTCTRPPRLSRPALWVGLWSWAATLRL